MIDDIKITEKNIKRQILLSILPYIKEFSSYLNNVINKIRNVIITFTGEATGTLNMTTIDTNNNIDININVVNNSHTHTDQEIDGSILPDPNSIVKRDIAGYIYSSGTTKQITGFKLANGVDIGTLFNPKNVSPIVLQEVGTIGSNNTVTDISIQKISDNHFQINKTYTWICNCSLACACRCCC